MQQQSIKSQKGEIEFRKKLVKQQVGGKCIFDDEFDAQGIESILSDRMKKTFEQMTLLRKRGVALSPYVEIGAERCQRSLVMENDLDASGAAVDISYDMLKSCDYYKDVFNENRVPVRICCDANSLPFMTDSIAFAFCYETLHHFPDPSLIVTEIHRVLSPGGHFLFDEEPYKKVLHVNLYQGKKIYSKESLGASKIRQIFDYFFSERSCNEVEHSIIENDEIPIAVWKQALSFFEEKNVRLKSMRYIDTELFNPKNYAKFLLAYLFGGGISGICRKSGASIEREISIHDVLICPSCVENGHESKLGQSDLSFFCNACGNKFPIVDGVLFLFSYRKFEELYPEIFLKAIRGLE